MKKLVRLLIPVLFFTAVACHRSRDSRIDFVSNRISSELDLNDEQETKLKDLAQAIKEQVKQRPQPPTEELKILLDAPVLDAVQSKVFFEKRKTEMIARADTIYAAVYPKFAAFHDSLNEDQRKKALALMEKFHRKWHED